MLGERLMPKLVKLLDGPAVSYGKGAIVGVSGEMEHGGACGHPMVGKPMRAAIGGGKAVIGSNVKVAAAGTLLDVPLGHKDDSSSFPHFDTIMVSVADAPRPDEILVVMAIADGGRLRNRAGPSRSDRANSSSRCQTSDGFTSVSRKFRSSSVAQWRRTGLDHARLPQSQRAPRRTLGEYPAIRLESNLPDSEISGSLVAANTLLLLQRAAEGRRTEADCDRQPVPRYVEEMCWIIEWPDYDKDELVR
jgi:Amino acid synthesis